MALTLYIEVISEDLPEVEGDGEGKGSGGGGDEASNSKAPKHASGAAKGEILQSHSSYLFTTLTADNCPD